MKNITNIMTASTNCAAVVKLALSKGVFLVKFKLAARVRFENTALAKF